jgi:plastocyanin
MKRRLRTGGSLMVLMVALALATAACSSGSSSSSGSSGGSTTPPPSPTATQGGGSSGGGGGGGGAKSATVQAGAGGFVFAPSTVSIATGGTITVQNAGTIPHTFTIQDKGINEVLNAGQSAKVKVDLAPGTYQFVCTFHQSSGMTGTLTVT